MGNVDKENYVSKCESRIHAFVLAKSKQVVPKFGISSPIYDSHKKYPHKLLQY